MERILINSIDELLKFLSKPELNNAELCSVLADGFGVYADPSKDKEEIIKGFRDLWNNYRLKGLDMPLFV